MPELRIEYLPLQQLVTAELNPKRHRIEGIASSIGRFGYAEPIVVDDRTGRLVAGHGRRETLLKMKAEGQAPPAGVQLVDGDWTVPVVRGWSSKSDADAQAYLVASNRHVEAGGWDEGELAALLSQLGDLTGTGFESEDLDELLEKVSGAAPGRTDPDDVPEPAEVPWVQTGELFELGRHRILCGDSTKPEDVDRVMAGAAADLCWTDPPWNVAYGEKANPAGWSGRPRAIANDNLGAAFPAFCAAFCGEIRRVLKPGAALYLAMSAQEWPTIHGALVALGLHWSSTLIWAKDSLVLSRKDYHAQYEPIWYGWRADAPRLHPLDDRTQSDVWNIPRPKRSAEHPTMKPVELVQRALLNSSKKGAVVYEPFSGSGTTIMAAEVSGRSCRAIELEPRYVQVALERWEAHTGKKVRAVSR